MRLAGRKWRTLVSVVWLGRDSYRVIRPAHPIVHASLYESRLGPELSVDRAATVDIAFAWWLTARSPRSLIYLPLRSSASSCGEEYGGRKLDLVLLHHSLQFPVARWKQVRARLSPYEAHTVALPAEPFRRFDCEEHRRPGHPNFHDHLRWTVAADTLFLVGSRHAYELVGDEMRGLAEDCPGHLAATPDAHCCVEIGIGRCNTSVEDRRDPPARLHIKYCDAHWEGQAEDTGGGA